MIKIIIINDKNNNNNDNKAIISNKCKCMHLLIIGLKYNFMESDMNLSMLLWKYIYI